MEETPAAILVERTGAVGWITLNRPGQINAINDAIRHGVPAALKELEADPAIGAIIIRGSGPRGFCAGADIKEKRGPETTVDVERRMKRFPWMESVATTTKPVIAAIHGFCMGGGMELALVCDIRIASKDAVFALPEVNLGLIPGAGGTQRLPRLIGLSRALEMMLTGDRINAEEALRLGIITRMSADAESVVKDAEQLALKIAAKPATARAFVKEAARAAVELDLAQGLDLERRLFSILATSEERKQAAQAFAEKRPLQS